ncbi:MAG: hypothetical protein J6J31_05540 [Thermoguttaceae bacterium]|nr:hypothetical protein [Thermoguttaceae bacterium]
MFENFLDVDGLEDQQQPADTSVEENDSSDEIAASSETPSKNEFQPSFCGWKWCTICDCQAFIQQGGSDMCVNCGHHRNLHY